MNRLAKGKRNEKTIAEMFKNDGLITDYYIAPIMKFRANNDIFNLFDFIGISKDGVIYLVQVKSHPSDFYKARKKLNAWAAAMPKLNFIAYLVLYQGKRKELRLYRVGDHADIPG
jgi:hypothetical protein